jgi:hypothetical protein
MVVISLTLFTSVRKSLGCCCCCSFLLLLFLFLVSCFDARRQIEFLFLNFFPCVITFYPQKKESKMTNHRCVFVRVSNNHRLEDRRVVDDALKTKTSQIDRFIFEIRQILGDSPADGRSMLQAVST